MTDQPQNSVEYMLGRLEGKVDMILEGQTAQNTRLDDHDKQLSSLNKGRAWLLGAGAALSAATSAVAANLFHR